MQKHLRKKLFKIRRKLISHNEVFGRFREDIDLVRFHVYLRREEIGEKRRIVSDSLSRRRYNTGRNQRKEVKSYYEFKQDVSAEQIAGQDL